MHIRRFEGSSMREVLREVRETLGPDALVVSTKHLRRDRGLFGQFGKPTIEVTAAVDHEPARASAPQSGQPHASWNELRLARSVVTPLEGEIQQLRAMVERMSPTSHLSEDIAGELRALRRVTSQLASARDGRSAAGPLVAAGIDPRHADASAAPDAPWHEIVDDLARRLDAALAPPRSDEDAAILYVGPPGVGKTTTIAKVASRTSESRDDLVIVTTDVHRLGGDAALRGFADAQRLPFHAAPSADHLATTVSKMGRRRIVVDTAGRSHRDPGAVSDLQALREALGPRGRVCLVLSATQKPEDLRADLARYRSLAPDALAFTKLDESQSLGNVANVLLDGDCPPLHWITTGQCIPDDLEVADPRDLAERILGVAA